MWHLAEYIVRRKLLPEFKDFRTPCGYDIASRR